MDENYVPKYGFHGKMVNPYIYPSKYFVHVNRYMKKFGKENVHVVFFEEMISDLEKIIQYIFNFLEVKKINVYNSNSPPLNPYKKNRSIWIAKINDLYLLSKIKKYIPCVIKRNFFDKLIYQEAPKEELEKKLYKKIYIKHFKNDISMIEELLDKELKEVWSIEKKDDSTK
ncbi:MAG: hypothetical protein D3916_14125 [Candidatus Electrothrix sp. MAN1_4]|nr:hypothetical protein [Candidatus Electrothrix sp. MAN1_4]